jgi:hypothetical protein
MSTVPSKINERIQWFEQRIDQWDASPASIGLSPSSVAALKTAIEEARSAYDTAQLARIAAKNATLGQGTMVRNMSDLGADAIRYIRAFADSRPTEVQRDAVYQAASVPPPAQPQPAGMPVPPTAVVADPNADGTVTIRWRGSTANQTFFTIWRRVGNMSTWSQIGSVATKSFVDAGVPAGTPSVRYYIRSQRNDEVSPPSEEAVVNFGVSGSAPGLSLAA